MQEMLIQLRGQQRKPIGLVNLKNKCFCNSVIQALYMNKLFVNLLINDENIECPCVQYLNNTFLDLMYSKKDYVCPIKLILSCRMLRNSNNTQQDAFEFLQHLFTAICENGYKAADKLATECLASSSSSSSDSSVNSAERDLFEKKCRSFLNEFQTSNMIIEKIFSVKLKTNICCSKCQSDSTTSSSSYTLHLSFPERNKNAKYSIKQLIELNFNKEMLTGDNQYRCAGCESLQDAERSVSIELAPRSLIVSLNLVWYNEKTGNYEKLLRPVGLDECIELDEGGQKVPYTMYAVVVHSGISLHSGHYYTIATDTHGQWYIFNDQTVQKCSKERAFNFSENETPYIVFYQRSDSGDATEFELDKWHLPYSCLSEKLVKTYKDIEKDSEVIHKVYKKSGQKKSTLKMSDMVKTFEDFLDKEKHTSKGG